MTQTHVVAKILLTGPGGKVLILRRSKDDAKRPLDNDLPGGMVEEGEDFVAAVIRETEEEAGINLQPADLQLAYTHTEMRGENNVCWLLFVGHTDQSEVTLSPEHDKADWVTLDQAIERITYHLQHDFLTYVRDNNLL